MKHPILISFLLIFSTIVLNNSYGYSQNNDNLIIMGPEKWGYYIEKNSYINIIDYTIKGQLELINNVDSNLYIDKLTTHGDHIQLNNPLFSFTSFDNINYKVPAHKSLVIYYFIPFYRVFNTKNLDVILNEKKNVEITVPICVTGTYFIAEKSITNKPFFSKELYIKMKFSYENLIYYSKK